jgi:hypothetical protein
MRPLLLRLDDGYNWSRIRPGARLTERIGVGMALLTVFDFFLVNGKASL